MGKLIVSILIGITVFVVCFGTVDHIILHLVAGLGQPWHAIFMIILWMIALSSVIGTCIILSLLLIWLYLVITEK